MNKQFSYKGFWACIRIPGKMQKSVFCANDTTSAQCIEAFPVTYLQLPKHLCFYPHHIAMRAKPNTLF